jgi:hypothetical protein
MGKVVYKHPRPSLLAPAASWYVIFKPRSAKPASKMKKQLITLFIATAACVTAQDTRLTVGSKFSFGHSYLMPYSNNVFHPSWAVGVAFEYRTGENLGFGADILYSSEGAKFKTGDLTASTELDYLRVPLRVIYHFGEAEKDLRFRIFGGPTPGILFAEGTGYKDMDLGLNAGLGINYQLADDFWITADADYYHGLMDIHPAGPIKEKNGNIRLNIGLMFGF